MAAFTGGGYSLNRSRKAFTLAETLIVLVILGIVAAITIPALVRRHVESSNRTRIKKAMTVYDTAINKMVVENGIKSNDALINEFNADKNNNSCAKSRAYFKTSQDGANDCIFKASDGIWWNISDINHPIIAFNEDDLTDEIASGDTNRAFKLVGYLDDNGSLRVSDLAKAEGDNQEYLTKLYNFMNSKKVKNNVSIEENIKPKYDGKIEFANAIKTICEEKPYKSCYNKYGYDPKTGYEPALLYDSNGNVILDYIFDIEDAYKSEIDNDLFYVGNNVVVEYNGFIYESLDYSTSCMVLNLDGSLHHFYGFVYDKSYKVVKDCSGGCYKDDWSN